MPQGPNSGETWTQYVVQPTEFITNIQIDASKHLEKKSGKLSRSRNLIVMKLIHDVSCHVPDVYTRFQGHISKLLESKLQAFYSGGELCW